VSTTTLLNPKAIVFAVGVVPFGAPRMPRVGAAAVAAFALVLVSGPLLR
jgi:threonine/homoserine/homoserine lactone efflux protein